MTLRGLGPALLVGVGLLLWGAFWYRGAPGQVGAGEVMPQRAYPAASLAPAGARPAPVAQVLVPAGPFYRGCEPEDRFCDEDEKPRREIHLSAYYMDLHEVTNARYAAFLNSRAADNRCANNPCVLPAGAFHRGLVKREGRWRVPAGYQQRPVVFVTWFGAAAYCRWRGRRLPTEAEWEKAAKGARQHHIYPWGDRWRARAGSSWKSGDPYRRGLYPWTTPVGHFDGAVRGGYQTLDGRSPYGLHDMAGNVWEWVSDWYGPGYYARSPARDPVGPPTGRFRCLRGGGWRRDLGDLGLHVLRVSDREEDVAPGVAGPDLGFRCALDARPRQARPAGGGP